MNKKIREKWDGSDIDAPVPAGRARLPFRLSRHQQAHLEDWLDPQAPKTISGIGAHINVPRRTIQSWLTRDDFVGRFNAVAEGEGWVRPLPPRGPAFDVSLGPATAGRHVRL